MMVPVVTADKVTMTGNFHLPSSHSTILTSLCRLWVNQELSNNIATIGENMNIRRAEYLEVSEGVLVSYIHNKVTEDLGKLGVMVAIESQAQESQLLDVGKQVAMHIAATSPKSLEN